MTPQEWAEETRRAQGLPPRVEDPDCLTQIAALLAPTPREGVRAGKGKVGSHSLSGPPESTNAEHDNRDASGLSGSAAPSNSQRPVQSLASDACTGRDNRERSNV